uniref:Zinc finger DBF-type containing 2 n=1 Tax=Saimiri boliviensis boliviensis TaxID=39432 RepID=A0A2K6S404_SAIBB
MQKRQGYCSYCRVPYNNLEQHLFSAQHRSLTRQSRRQICTSSLMERFLQDVLQHHPYHCQESSSTQNETYVNTGSSSEVVHSDDDFSEEEEEDENEVEDEDATEERPSEASERIEELHSRPHESQEGTKEVSVRPSVIQKLEKGQQQPLEFGHKIGASMKKCNPEDTAQATNNGSNLVRPPVIYNAPASCLPESSNGRPVTTNSTGLPPAVHLDSASKCGPNKVDNYLEQPDRASRNPVPSSHLETSSASRQKQKESSRKSLRINSDKLVLRKDVKSQGKTVSAGLKFHERVGTKGSLKVKSPSKLAANPSKTDMPSNKGIFEDTIPKHREKFFSNMDCTQEEKHLVFNKKAFLDQKCSVSSAMKFACSSLQSASDQPQEAAQDLNLWKEERIDQEDNYESRESEMSFDCSSSFYSLTDQSKGSAKEVNHSKKVRAAVPYKSNKSCISEVSSDCDDVLQLVTNQSQISLQNTMRVSLVDQSYESSSSETNFDCDASPQSTSDDYPQQSVKEVNLPKEAHIGLVDKNYGSSSSELSADSVFPLQSAVDRPSVAVTETKLRKKAHTGLVDNYGSSCSETSFDCDVSLDHMQLTVKGRNLKGRQVHLKHKKRKPSSAKAHLDCDVSLGTVADESQRAVAKMDLLKEKNADLMDMNCESQDPEMGFHTDAQLVADQSQVAIKEIDLQKVDVDLENKSVQSSSTSLSSDSPASLYHSAHDEPQEALDEVNLKELNIDMEVKSYDCSSSELTFDSDPPLLSVTEQSQLDAEGKERHLDLEDESCESDSSEITFDSDIPLYSVVDQPEVAVYEEETVDLESKSNESCVSEITFDSDIPLHSGNDHPEVAVKEVIQKEEYIHLERKNDEPSGSEINSDSYAPLHSVTNSPEVAVKKLYPQKEEQRHLENKENEPTNSEVSLDYNTMFHSVTGHSEDSIKEINLHKKEHMYLENKSVFETGLDSHISLQSAMYKPEVIVKETWLQREKYTEFQDGSVEFSGLRTSLDSGVSQYSVIEPQAAVNKTNRKKQCVLENKSDKCSGSEIILDSNIPPQSMTDQPQLAFLREKYVNLKDRNSKSSDSKITLNSEQLQEAVKKIDQWKEEVIGLKNKINEPNTSKLIHDSNVSVQSVADQPQVAIKHVNLGNENHMYLGVKNSQYSCSEMNVDSGFLVQSIVSRPQMTVLEQEQVELEDKPNQRCGSEVSFDSDDPLQSVADRLRETVKEISLWKDEDVDMEDRRDEAKSFEIMYDSDVLQSVAGQPEEVVKEVGLWKEHADLENKIVKPTDSKINFDSHEPLQSMTSNIQGVNQELNLLVEEHVCLNEKSYAPSNSEIIYVSNIPLQSVIKQPHILEGEHANLEDKSSDSCSPEESSDFSDSFQAAADGLQKSVKEVNLWKEDHIYLEDKSYKLGDFDVSCTSHIPVQFVTDQSSVSVEDINLQKKDRNDLEKKNCKTCGSEIKCGSCVNLQSEVDQPQVTYKEADLQKEDHVMEKTDEPIDSEMMYDSDIPFQIVVNQFQGSDKETHLPKVVLVNVIPSDGDYEVISDDTPLQLVTDPPQLTVKDINCINTECMDIEDKSCDSFGSEVRCSCKASSPSMTSQCKETFKIINRKKDYIILGEPSCQSCGSEMNFNVDASNQSMTYESQEPDKKMVKYIDSEDNSCGYNGSKGKFNLEGTSHRKTHRMQKAHKEANLRKDPRNASLKGKSCQSSASAVDFGVSSKSALHRRADRKKLKLKHGDLESVSQEPADFEMNFQCAPPLRSDTHQPQETVKRRHPCKKVSFDLKQKNCDSQPSSVPKVDSVRNLKKAKDIIEDNPDEPVLEALPHVPPSFVGKTWSQIMREDDMKINALVKEFREGRFHCYFDDDCETTKVFPKKKRVTWADLQGKEDTAPIQALSESDDTVRGSSDIDDLSVALDQPCHRHPPAENPSTQKWPVASECRTANISHSTQTSCKNYPVLKRKIIRQEEDPPKSKCSRLQDDRKTKKNVKIGTKVEFPASCTKVLKPMQPKALVCVLSSLNIKLKEGEGPQFPKMRHHSWDNDIRFICKYKWNIFDYFESLIRQIVGNSPLNLIVPEFERHNWVKIHFNRSNLNSSAGDNDADGQSSASVPLLAAPARYGFNSHQRTSESSLFLEESKVLQVHEVPKKSNFQLTFLNHGVVKNHLNNPESVRNKFFKNKSKKKIHGKKVTASGSKLGFPKKVCKPIIPRKKARKASGKQSASIWTKPSEVIRKYMSKYSAFLYHRCQSRYACFGMYPKKKKTVVGRLKKAKRTANVLSNSSVSPAGAEELSSAIANPPPKQPVRFSSRIAEREEEKKRNEDCQSQKKISSGPVRAYNLRSSSCSQPCERMMTRLANKLRGNEVK